MAGGGGVQQRSCGSQSMESISVSHLLKLLLYSLKNCCFLFLFLFLNHMVVDRNFSITSSYCQYRENRIPETQVFRVKHSDGGGDLKAVSQKGKAACDWVLILHILPRILIKTGT